MKDIEIKISQETRMVDLKKTVIGNDAENLQGNLIFSFTDDFVNGTARLEYEIAGNKRYIMLEKNNNTYSVPIKSVLTKKGQINMQLVITEGTSENDIPIFKSNIFYVFCNQSINAEIEQPDEYPSWIEIANSKINEVDEAILGVEEAKKYAIEKGDYAKEQGDYAKSQGDYAKEQKIEVVKANEEANRIINNFETNVGGYTTAFNENANNKTIDFDSNAESKTSGFNQNVDNKISEYNNNASEKLSAYNTNAENKKSEFDTNVANQTKAFNDNASSKLESYNQNDTTKTNAFNDNATNKTNAFNNNANSKTETYNNNHTEKINAYNTNATSKLNEYNTNASTKLQEYNTNADNKIAEYDLHSQELDNKIIATRNELERVKNDVLETGTDTDTFVHLEDSAMAEYQELSIDGICEQETTSGKNLYNKDTDEVGKVYSNTGVFGDTLVWTTSDWISVESGTEYYIHNLTTNTQNLFVSEFNENKTFIQRTLGRNIITTANTKYIRLSFKNDLGMYDIQITKGTMDTKYEPYTGGQPSPNPDYPQEIKTIENSLKITSCNKNLFDMDYVKGSVYGSYTITNNIITFIPSETSVNSRIIILIPKDKFIVGQKYTIKANGCNRIAVGYSTSVNDTSNYLYFVNKSNVNNVSFTYSDIPTDYVCIYLYNTESTLGTNWTLSEIQLEKNSTATPFEQHLESQITANLPEGEFIGKINDTYKDTLKVEYNEEDGQYQMILKKMIGKVILDGSEHWDLGITPVGNRFYTDSVTNYIEPSDNNELFKVYCDRFTPTTGNKSWTNTNPAIASSVAGYKYILIVYNNDNITTTAQFKNWLSTHNTTVYYPLETPYVVDLGVVDMPITYNEITNLFTDSDLLPTINAKYYRNFISTVRNLQVNEKALKQELIDINNRLSALETAQTNAMSESEVVE